MTVRGKPPRYSGIEIPASFESDAVAFAQAVKDRLEKHSGDRGDPRERFVTMRDLELAGIARVDVKNNYATARSLDASGASATTISDIDVNTAVLSLLAAYLASNIGEPDELPDGGQVLVLDPETQVLKRFDVSVFDGLRADEDADISANWGFNGAVFFNAEWFFDDVAGTPGDLPMVDAEGLMEWLTPGNITRVDDTNVTLTLGGTPTASVLRAVSLTLGWTGQLAASRGGTGFGTYTTGDTLYASDASALSKLAIGSAADVMRVSGGLPVWQAPAALTKTDDTNVTLTLGGSHATSLLAAASLTLGWTGTLALSRGGTGFGSYAKGDIIIASDVDTLSKLAIGTTGQVLKVDATGVPVWAADATGGGGGSLTDGDYGDITVSASATVLTIDAGVVTLAKMANLAANSIIGNNTGSSATPIALTAAQVRTLINVADGATANSAANPSASVGLTAVNGAAATFMRSDAAPALDQGIAPSWTAGHTFAKTFVSAGDYAMRMASTLPVFRIDETDAATDEKTWYLYASAGVLNLVSVDDALSTGRAVLTANRNGHGIDLITYGNATDYPAHQLYGTIDGFVTAGRSATFDSSSASGSYVTFERSGTAFGDVGNGATMGAGFTTDSLALGARAGNPVEMAANGNTNPQFRISVAGSVLAGEGSVSTTATDEFLYIPTCAGTPTGTPTTVSGLSPLVVDTTNNALYFYSSAAWRQAAGGGATDAVDVAYDNATSGAVSTDVQAALDEIFAWMPLPNIRWVETFDFVGQEPWQIGISVGGTVTFNFTPSAGHPGVVEISTGASTATSNGFLRVSSPLAPASSNVVVGGGEMVYEALVEIPTLWAGANQGQMRAGFMDEITGAPSNGIHVQYDHTSANWQLYTRAAGTSTQVIGGTAVTTGWHHVRIVVNSGATSVELFVDGVSQGTSTTNIPTAGMSFGAQVQKTASTTAAILRVDTLRVKQTFSTPRW